MSKEEKSPVPTAVEPKNTIEHWAEAHQTPDWLFAAAKVGAFQDIEGFETTEEGYLAALKHTLNTPIGYTKAGVKATMDAHKKTNPCDKKAVEEYACKHIRKLGKGDK